MSTDHYLLLLDLGLFALAIVFLRKLMTQWIIQGRTTRLVRGVALGLMMVAGWTYIIYRYGPSL
jgi:hypothetical protein